MGSAQKHGVRFPTASSNPQIAVVLSSSPTNTGNAAIAQRRINDSYTPHHCFCSRAGPGPVNKGISGSGVWACQAVFLSAMQAASSVKRI